MGWLRVSAAALCWMVLSGSAWGADMRLGLAGSAEYDTNALRTESDEEDDWVFRLIPKVSFLEEEGKLHWSLNYRMPWERAIETERVDGLRHFVDAQARYHLSGRTQIFLEDTFRYSEAVSSVTEISAAGVPTVGTFREPILRNLGRLGVQHNFTPRLAGNLAFTHRYFESDLVRRRDNRVYIGNTNLIYAVSPRHQLGGGLAANYQDFDASRNGGQPPSQTLFFNVYGIWSWAVDETTTFELTAGPTFVDSDQDAPPTTIDGFPAYPSQTSSGGALLVFDYNSCPMVNGQRVLDQNQSCPVVIQVDPLDEDTVRDTVMSVSFPLGTEPGSQSDTTWTFFGEAKLTKRWKPDLLSTFRYSRTESTASGIASATLDLVSLITTWRITERWIGELRGDFTWRKSTSPAYLTLVEVGSGTLPNTGGSIAVPNGNLTSVEVDQVLDTRRWGVAARIARRVTKNLTASLRYSYNQQSSDQSSSGRYSDFENHLVTLGVQYDFDRWHLW